MTAAAMTVLRWAAPSPKGGDDDQVVAVWSSRRRRCGPQNNLFEVPL